MTPPSKPRKRRTDYPPPPGSQYATPDQEFIEGPRITLEELAKKWNIPVPRMRDWCSGSRGKHRQKADRFGNPFVPWTKQRVARLARQAEDRYAAEVKVQIEAATERAKAFERMRNEAPPRQVAIAKAIQSRIAAILGARDSAGRQIALPTSELQRLATAHRNACDVENTALRLPAPDPGGGNDAPVGRPSRECIFGDPPDDLFSGGSAPPAPPVSIPSVDGATDSTDESDPTDDAS